MAMAQLPFTIAAELEGWQLFWARLEVANGSPDGLAALRTNITENVRSRFTDTAAISGNPTVSALRRLFRAAGCDPTRYRPSSEALLRRLVRGDSLPEIHPLVDLNNCLSAELAVPCCVMTEGSFGPDLVWRAGRPGEAYESLRGPFQLEGKPVLFDSEGPLDTPITGNQRVKVRADSQRAWLVAYMPASEVSHEQARATLVAFGDHAGVRNETFDP
jgi:DNA/RNA-binding domain of Phe-tRNA-synthetase-like protein